MRILPSIALASVLLACGSTSSSTRDPSGSEAPPDEAPHSGSNDETVPAGDGVVWTIASERVDCVGEAPMRCLRVREGDGEWQLFYDAIEGFTHEEGTEYDVRVRISTVDDPPADGSSRRVELIEVLETRAAAGACASNADCEPGQMCAGPQGCDVAWTCQPMRACTRDMRVYCGCDGSVLRGSGSCPPAPYRNRGPCE